MLQSTSRNPTSLACFRRARRKRIRLGFSIEYHRPDQGNRCPHRRRARRCVESNTQNRRRLIGSSTGPERHRSAARRKTIPAAHEYWERCKRRGRLVSHRAPATPPTTRRIGRKIARNLTVDRYPRRLRVRGKAYDSDARTRGELMGSPWHRTNLDQSGASSVHRLRGRVQSNSDQIRADATHHGGFVPWRTGESTSFAIATARQVRVEG